MEDRTVTFGSEAALTAPIVGTWGPLQLIERVGQGSFGEVYRAFDNTLQRPVALKLLLSNGLGKELEERTLLQEARAMARVRHPNVVPVYGVDTHHGRIGFWSDFVNGKTLSAIVAADGPFGAREATLIGVDICKAVGAVHAAGLLHRDIKTGNVMRESGGRILLMDFGLTHDREAVHHHGGTLLYMAPELLNGAPATVATDIYAIGVLLFYLLTGQYPVERNSFQEMESAHQSGERQLLLDVRPDLPEPLARAIDTAVDGRADKRYRSAGQMISALTDAAGLSSFRSAHQAEPFRRKLPAWWIVGGAAAVLVIGAATLEVSSRVGGKVKLPFIASVQDDYAKAHDLLDHYYRPRALETAIPLLEKIVAENASFAPAFADLGRANMLQFTQLRDAKYLEPARQASLHALSLQPDLASAHVTLGTLYTWTGKNDLAAQQLDQAVKLDKFNSAAYVARGNLLLRQGRGEEALFNLQKAVDLTPEDWGAAGQLASYYDEVGQYGPAAEQYQRAAQLASDNPRALNNLGLVYRKQGRLADAEAAYRKSIALEPTAGHYRNLGQALLENGNFREATVVLERAVNLKADNYRSWGLLAAAYAQSGVPAAKVNETYRKAIVLTESVRKLTPDDTYLFADLGKYYAALSMAKEAAASLRQAEAYSANTPEVLYQIALGYELLHKRDQSLNFIERAVAAGISPKLLERNLQLSALRADERYRSMIIRVSQSK